MATGIPLKSLADGVEWISAGGGAITLGAGRQVNVYKRNTTTQVQVYSDQALTAPLTQPLTTAADGTVPGFVAAEQAIDFFDVATSTRAQAEPLSVADLIGSDGKIGSGGVALSTTGIAAVGDGRYAQLGATIKEKQLPSNVAKRHWLGLNGNSLSGYGPVTGVGSYVSLGFVYDRLEFTQPATITSAASSSGVTLATSIANGMIPVVLIEPSTYGSGAIPSGANITTFANYVVAQIEAVEAAYPDAGILYEIINEPWTTGNFSPAPTAANHADVVKGVCDACIAAGLDMTRIYFQVQNPAWLSGMYAQQSTLETEVQGWAVHPYGAPPPGYASSTTQGIASVPVLRAGMQSGADNILISEVGIRDYSVVAGHSTDENTALDGTTAGIWARQIIDCARAYHAEGWLKALLWYNRNSDSWATNAAGGALTNIGTALQNHGQPPKRQRKGYYTPADDGYKTATLAPEACRDSISLTSGKLYLARFRVDERDFAQFITAHVNTAGATLTAAECFAAILDALGNKLDVTGDQSAVWNSTGRKSMSFGGDNFKPGTFWFVLLANGTTPPQFAGATANPLLDGNGGAAPTRFMQSSASTFTTIPSSVTLSSCVPTSSGIYLALS